MDQRLIAVAVVFHWCPQTVLCPAIGACWCNRFQISCRRKCKVPTSQFATAKQKNFEKAQRIFSVIVRAINCAARHRHRSRLTSIQWGACWFLRERGASARRFVNVRRPVKPAFLASEPVAQIDDFEAFAQAVRQASREEHPTMFAASADSDESGFAADQARKRLARFALLRVAVAGPHLMRRLHVGVVLFGPSISAILTESSMRR